MERDLVIEGFLQREQTLRGIIDGMEEEAFKLKREIFKLRNENARLKEEKSKANI